MSYITTNQPDPLPLPGTCLLSALSALWKVDLKSASAVQTEKKTQQSEILALLLHVNPTVSHDRHLYVFSKIKPD